MSIKSKNQHHLETNNFNQIIEEIKAGRETILRAMYPKYQQSFLQWARSFNHAFDQDTLIEAYMEAIKVFYINVLNGRLKNLTAPVEYYLIGIGKNYLLRKAKNNKITITTEDVSAQNPQLDLDFLTQAFEDEEKEELKNKLLKAFNELGSQCQNLLRLFYFENKKAPEIKEEMNYKDENNVYASKSRCLSQLRDIILNLK